MDNHTKQLQSRRVFDAFYGKPKTMLQVAKETGILRANICRYLAKFQKQQKIVEVWEGPCPVSRHKAAFYSTHPKYFPTETQATLFDAPTKSRAYQL